MTGATSPKYLASNQYKDALAAKADIYLVFSGTCDSLFYINDVKNTKPGEAYKKMIKSFQQAPNNPKVYMMNGIPIQFDQGW